MKADYVGKRFSFPEADDLAIALGPAALDAHTQDGALASAH